LDNVRDKSANIISPNRVPREDKVQDEDCRVYSLNGDFVERARIEGQKDAKFPASIKHVASEGLDDESAQFSLKQVGGVEEELGIRTGGRGVAEGFLDSRMKSDDIKGRPQPPGNRGDVLRNVGLNISSVSCRGVGVAVGRARATEVEESSIRQTREELDRGASKW
jgi:hypothetical protein